MEFGEAAGQGWLQIGELCLAFALSALIGAEREIRHKSAGLRTYTLVGFASALIVLVSKYGFGDVLSARVVLDPSRVAAQIVSGIGFIGGGLIFVHRDSVRGLTTAAIVWLVAAIGMACGAGLPLLAIFVTALHFVVVFGFPYVIARLPKSRWAPTPLEVSYEAGRDLLKEILAVCTEHDFTLSRVRVERGTAVLPRESRRSEASVGEPKGVVTVALEVEGASPVAKLASRLSEIEGVVSVRAGGDNAGLE